MKSAELAFSSGTKPPVRDIISKRLCKVKPLEGWDCNTASRVSFYVPVSTDEFISSSFILAMTYTITTANGAPLPPAENVATMSLPGLSFFNDCELSIGGTVLEGLGSLFYLKGYLKATLALSNLAKDTYAKPLLKLYRDTAGEAQSTNAALNTGFGSRKAMTAASALVTTRAALPLDVSSSNLAFPSGTEIKITLQWRTNSERLISDVANANFKVRMDNLELEVEYLRLQEQSLLSLRHRLSSGPLIYPYLQAKLVGPLNVAVGLREVSLVISRGLLPELAIACWQPQVRTSASYTENAYDFNLHGVEFAMMECSGVQWPTGGYRIDAARNEGTQQIYSALVETTKCLSGDGNAVPLYDDWARGEFFVPFPLRPHLPSPVYANEEMFGELTLKLRFTAPTTDVMSVYVLCVSSARLAIHQNRSVSIQGLL